LQEFSAENSIFLIEKIQANFGSASGERPKFKSRAVDDRARVQNSISRERHPGDDKLENRHWMARRRAYRLRLDRPEGQ
jgi:hypothetical protein